METLWVTLWDKQTRQFVIVRTISKLGDLGISNSIVFLHGEGWLILGIAMVAGAVFNCTFDYTAQKLGPAKLIPKVRARQTTSEILLYLLIRGLYAIPAAAVIAGSKLLGIPYLLSSLVVTIGFLFISLKPTKGLYSGTIRGLPQTFRQVRVWYKRRLIRILSHQRDTTPTKVRS